MIEARLVSIIWLQAVALGICLVACKGGEGDSCYGQKEGEDEPRGRLQCLAVGALHGVGGVDAGPHEAGDDLVARASGGGCVRAVEGIDVYGKGKPELLGELGQGDPGSPEASEQRAGEVAVRNNGGGAGEDV
jgi:hypothetical protein